MNEGYSPEEAERIKQIIEIGESQKQIKQSFWNEVNTPEVLKLKEESNILWKDYWSIDKKLREKIIIHNSNLSIYACSISWAYISVNVFFLGVYI